MAERVTQSWKYTFHQSLAYFCDGPERDYESEGEMDLARGRLERSCQVVLRLATMVTMGVRVRDPAGTEHSGRRSLEESVLGRGWT